MIAAKGDLILAIPNKGRLQEAANARFARAGLIVEKTGNAREYLAKLKGLSDSNVTIAFLSAGEIAASLAQGSVHIGVTGEDLLRETIADFDASIRRHAPLGFGRADVVVAVPQAWIDVTTMADLDDVALAFHNRHRRRLRVATKYANLTMAFFARHDVGEYRIVESLGATEGAPAVGAAEVIVDITSTGATLTANKLKVLDDGLILKSEARLAESAKARWTPPMRIAAERIFAAIAGT